MHKQVFRLGAGLVKRNKECIEKEVVSMCMVRK